MRTKKFNRKSFSIFLPSKSNGDNIKYLVSMFFTFIAVSIAIYMFIDKMIEKKITNPTYIQSLSKELRPYIFFSLNKGEIYNHTTNIKIENYSVTYDSIWTDYEKSKRDTVYSANTFILKFT